jgi:Zn-dependent protease with chaperone function
VSFELRLALVALAAFSVVNVAASVAVAAFWQRLARGEAAVRARRLVAIRALPVLAATAAMAWAAVTFILFEPRGRDETFGVLFSSIAVLPAVFAVSAFGRGIRAVHRARVISRHWLAGARPIALEGVTLPAFAIASPFPVVAVVGLFRPRLVVARSVLAACPPDELRAILAHERAHVLRRDNWTRLGLAVLPDALGWLPAAAGLASSWSAAAEDAADDGARTLGATGRLALAQALIRVARMAQPPDGSHALPDPSLLPATALFRGDDIARRVHRLLARPAASPAHLPRRRVGFRAAATSVALALAVLLMQPLHIVLETIVTRLP